VDLVPLKTCTYDCIYCQLGRTTRRTVERREWVPLDAVLDELKAKLVLDPDTITLSGSGEPTLYSRLEELIEGIRRMTDIPVAVLTNGSLLWESEVRRQLGQASLVMPSLDAGCARQFQDVNRPHPSLSFEKMLDGLISFREEFTGDYRLEVCLLHGYTDTECEVRGIAECSRRIRPHRVQLNTATRPTAEDLALRVDAERLVELAACFDPEAEVIAGRLDSGAKGAVRTVSADVLDLIRRRPCTLEDIATGLGIHRHEVVKHLEELQTRGVLETKFLRGAFVYRGRQDSPPSGDG
jgi:wyosine [tRNA(Phe)-imidazoG37] synthetase (radical SAM superfamily)